jgi:hypothetical protein
MIYMNWHIDNSINILIVSKIVFYTRACRTCIFASYLKISVYVFVLVYN